MQRSTILVTTICLLLSACGRGDPAADAALSRMHDRVMERVMSHAITLDNPLLAKTASSLRLSIFPASESFKSNATINITTTLLSDATDSKDPRADLTVSVTASSDLPSTTNGTKKGVIEPARVAVIVNARSIGRALTVNFPQMDVTAPTFLPTPFSLPLAISQRWYGTSFSEIDAMLRHREIKKEKQLSKPPFDVILTSALRGIQVTPEQLETFMKSAHLWKAIGILPSTENPGLLQIRVETDKRKIRDTIRALLVAVQEISGSSLESQMRTQGERKTLVNTLMKNEAEFMRTIGSVKGIISADRDTYDFREFSGDIFDEKGVKTATVEMSSEKGGNISLQIKNVKDQDTLLFRKTGDAVKLTVDGKALLTGTISGTRVDLTLTDGKTNNALGSAAFDIKTFTKEKIEITNGLFNVPTQKLTVALEYLTINLSNHSKDIALTLNASGTLRGKSFFAADFQTSRNETAPFPLITPMYVPLEELRKDFLDAFMPPAPTRIP